MVDEAGIPHLIAAGLGGGSVQGILEINSDEDERDVVRKFDEVYQVVREDDEWQISDLVAALPDEWKAKLYGYEDLYI